MRLRNEVYSQLRSFVDVNSGVDLNSYALLDEWSLLKNKNVIVYTFDENTMNFKVEYPTMVSSTSVIEILKTSSMCPHLRTILDIELIRKNGLK